MPKTRKQTSGPRGSEAAREFVQAATDRLRAEVTNGRLAAPTAPPRPGPAPTQSRPQPKPAPQPRPEPVGRQEPNTGLWLRNRYGWVLHYLADDDGRGDCVTVRRTYRGAAVGDLVMCRKEAVRHYRKALGDGFETFRGDL
jgi:hypothetical protein